MFDVICDYLSLWIVEDRQNWAWGFRLLFLVSHWHHLCSFFISQCNQNKVIHSSNHTFIHLGFKVKYCPFFLTVFHTVSLLYRILGDYFVLYLISVVYWTWIEFNKLHTFTQLIETPVWINSRRPHWEDQSAPLLKTNRTGKRSSCIGSAITNYTIHGST